MKADHVQPFCAWPPTTVIEPGLLGRLDQGTYELINAAGGEWAPSSPICIGGEGLDLSSPGSILRGIRTDRRGSIVCGDNDYPTFFSDRERDLVVAPFGNVVPYAPSGTSPFVYLPSADGTVVSMRGELWIPQLRTHDGATFDSFTFRFCAVEKPTLPSGGGAVTYQLELDAYADGVALSTATPHTVPFTDDEDFWLGGVLRSVTFPLDLANVVDASKAYSIRYQFIAKRGSNWAVLRPRVCGVTLHFTDIADMRPE